MQRFRTLAVALASILILGALAATSALAEEGGVILSTIPEAFKVSSGNTRFVPKGIGGKSILCAMDAGSGEFNTSRSGTVTIDFTVCSIEEGKLKCGSLGDALGTILAGGTIKLADIELNAKLTLAGIIELSEIHVECQGGILILIKGSVIGQFSGIESGVEKLTIQQEFDQKEGLQEIKRCKEPKTFCEGKVYELLAKIGTGFEQAALETAESVKFEKPIVVDF